MNKDIWKKYSEDLGVRFLKKEKDRFAKEIASDFEQLGMETHVDERKKGFGKIKNIYVGNIKQAKTIIAIPYDTPARVFWHRNDTYPQNGYLNNKKAFVPIYVPLLIMYGIMLALSYLPPLILPNVFTPMVMTVLTVWMFAFMIMVIVKGLPNFNNAIRNTSSIVMGYDLLSSLSKDKRKEVMIVFTDCKKHYNGNKFVDEYLQEHNKRNLDIIGLYCIGRGNKISITADKNTKSLARDIAKTYDGELEIEVRNVDHLGKEETAIQYFKNALLICSGENQDGDLVVKDTAIAKDRSVNEQLCDGLTKAIRECLIKKKK